MFHSIREAQEYLESFIKPTVFARIEENLHMKDPLDRMRVLLDLLGNPQQKFKSVQVSGTSGKGSTAYLLANILSTAGYKTGLAISPHLERISERMIINNQEIPEEMFLLLLNTLIPAIEQIKKLPEGEPSYFELLIALTFLYFAKEKVDIAVIEVGLEGKYDATNVLNPLVVILTNISKDHTELLGDTVEAIAGEALSIVHKNDASSPVIVTGIEQKTILQMLKQRTVEQKLRQMILGEEIEVTNIKSSGHGVVFSYRDKTQNFPKLNVSLRGEYQARNASLAIAATTALAIQGFVIPEDAIRNGLANAFFAGRFEVLQRNNKTFILDGAHNEAKMTAFLNALDQYYPNISKVFIVGFKKNKDMKAMLRQLFLRKGIFIFTEFHTAADYAKNISMTMPQLSESVVQISDTSSIYFSENVKNALTKVNALEETLIIVTGSLYLVGEVRSQVKTKE